MESNGDQLNAVVVVGGLVLANLAAVVGSYIAMRIAIAELKLITKQNTKDINGLAKVIGTPTAIARAQAEEEE